MEMTEEGIAEFYTDERNKLDAIGFLTGLPEVMEQVADVITDIYQQRLAFMSLLMKFMIDSGQYEISLSTDEVKYYEKHSLKISMDGQNLKLEIMFNGDET